MQPNNTRTHASLACEECRKRKSRCDRVRPQCGACAEVGDVCVVVEKRAPRGPKKGQMNALRTRVATLERQLNAKNSEKQAIDIEDPSYTPHHPDGSSISSSSSITPALTTAGSSLPSLEDDSSRTWPDTISGLDSGPFGPFDFHTMALPNQSYSYYGSGDQAMDSTMTPHDMTIEPGGGFGLLLNIPSLTRADLDDLFFDRVYPVAPIIHRRRYLSWSQSQLHHHHQPTYQLALQYAMWAVAASVSSQFRQLAEMLADGAVRVLGHVNAVEQEQESISLSQTQAWLLIAHYELLRKNDRQAALTAGRAIRLVQVAELHQIDAQDSITNTNIHGNYLTPPPSSPLPDVDTFIDMEEQRRTFWLAYSFDRFCLLSNNWHSLIPEELIRTRLPAPESNFQNSQPVWTDFLCKAISNSGKSLLPPFAECIVLDTLFSHCMVHQRLMTLEPSAGKTTRDLWSKHAWLSLAVEKRNRLLSQSLPRDSNMPDLDPMLLFSNVMAKCLRMYLSRTGPRTDWPADSPERHEQELSSLERDDRATQSLNDLICMAKTLPKFSCFKMHPCLPNLLYRTILLLVEEERSMGLRIWTNDTHGEILAALLAALAALQEVNNLAKELLGKLELLDLALRPGQTE